MQTTVQPYLAYRLTSSPFYLGLIGFASSLPALFLMLPTGVLIERMQKRTVVIVMQCIMMVQAFILAALTLMNVVTIWEIILLAFILGIANAIEITARQSMIIELVNKETLPNAIALNSTIFNLARVIGPSLSAPFMILFQDSGEGWAFFANGISYLFVIGSLMLIKSRSIIDTSKPLTDLKADFIEGQKYIRKTSIIAILIVMVTIPAFLGYPFSQQMPVFSSVVFKAAGDTDAIVATRNSLLVSAQGLGALIAAFSLALFSNIKRKGLMLAVGQIVFAVALVGFSQSKTVGMAAFLLILVGWGTVTHLAMTNTLIQLIIPNEFRARVMATYFWAQNGVAPFGSLLIGWMAQNWGASFAVLVGGSVCLVVASILLTIRPEVRKLIM